MLGGRISLFVSRVIRFVKFDEIHHPRPYAEDGRVWR